MFQFSYKFQKSDLVGIKMQTEEIFPLTPIDFFSTPTQASFFLILTLLIFRKEKFPALHPFIFKIFKLGLPLLVHLFYCFFFL